MHLLGRGLPNKYRLSNVDIQTVCLLLLCNSLISFHPLSPLGLMNREEFFVFQTFLIVWGAKCCSLFRKVKEKNFRFFSKTPPKNRFLFQTSEGTFNFLFKIPPFFRFPVQTSEGINFLKEIFEKSVNLGVHFDPLCPNE